MIFARLQYEQDYSDIHYQLDTLIRERFENVSSGLQGDSWIWITEGSDKVAIDTFTSVSHEIKSARQCRLVDNVMSILSQKYNLQIHDPPEPEAHE